MKRKLLEYWLIDKTSPILGADGSRGGVRPSQGMNVWEKYWKGGKFEAGGSARIPRRKGQKEEGRKGVFFRKPSRFEAVDGKRKKCACVYVRFCTRVYVYVCQLCVDRRKAERVSLEERQIVKCRRTGQRGGTVDCEHVGQRDWIGSHYGREYGVSRNHGMLF